MSLFIVRCDIYCRHTRITFDHLHSLLAFILETVVTGAPWWYGPMRQVKWWQWFFFTHNTWSKRDWKRREPSCRITSLLDQERGVICPHCTFSHGMIQCSVWLCNGSPVARIDLEGNYMVILSNWVQAGLILHQGYVPEIHHTNWTHNSHFKHCISLGLGDWQPNPI